MYRRYYSYNDMPQIVNRCEKNDEIHKCEEKKDKCDKDVLRDCKEIKSCEEKKLFGRFELDDVILGVIIVAILMDDGDDSPLLLALLAIFLTGIF